MRSSVRIIFLVFIFSVFSTLCFAKEKIVFLAGGNAWQLFEAYLNKEGNKVKLGNIKVKVWDGKEFKEYKIGWTEYLSGEGLRSLWRKKLSKVEAKYDPKAVEMAKQYGWELFVIEPKESLGVAENRTQEVKSSDRKQVCSQEAISHINLGLQFIQNRQVDNAIKEFSHATKLSPSCALAYANLVSAYVVKRNLNLAIETYRAGVAKAGDDGFLHFAGATAFTQRKDYDLALQALEKALQAGFRDRKAFEDPDLDLLFRARKKDTCDLLDKYGLMLRKCL